MLPFYLQKGYQQSVTRASAELKSQMPYYARVQADAHEIDQKKQRAEEIARREAFERRADEIGYANALIESAQKVNAAITEAKNELHNAIIYKK